MSLPADGDTSTFPADSYAALMSTVASKSCARALQYGPTEGLSLLKACIAQVMQAEGVEIDPDELLVTTGGQQVIDRRFRLGEIRVGEARRRF